MPAQPYSCGSVAPSRPSSAISGINSVGKRPLSKQSPMIGSTRSSVKRATASCTMRSSSLSSERTSYKSTGLSGAAGMEHSGFCGFASRPRILAACNRKVPPNQVLRVPVLTYHAVNIAGNDYANNDHVAFAADLRLITDLGLRIVPLHWVVDQLLGTADRDLSRCVALSCDDGSDFDFFDLVYPTHGPQRSLFNCMTD